MWEGLFDSFNKTLIIKQFFSSSVHDFFKDPLILKGWREVMVMIMMQSCHSTQACPSLSPAPPPPDQQQSFNQTACRSVLVFLLFWNLFPASSSHTLYIQFFRGWHTHTPTNTNSLSQQPAFSPDFVCVWVCACVSTGEEKVTQVLQSPSIYVFTGFTFIQPVRKLRPLHLTLLLLDSVQRPCLFLTKLTSSSKPEQSALWSSLSHVYLARSSLTHPLLHQSSKSPLCSYFERVSHSPA